MAELVDALDLGSSDFGRGGSSPPFRRIELNRFKIEFLKRTIQKSAQRILCYIIDEVEISPAQDNSKLVLSGFNAAGMIFFMTTLLSRRPRGVTRVNIISDDRILAEHCSPRYVQESSANVAELVYALD